MGMREFLIIAGLVIMAAIFFDAYRRVRDNRRSQFGFKLDETLVPPDEAGSSELPGGKARIVGRTHDVTPPFKASLVDEDGATRPDDDFFAGADYLAARRSAKPAQAAAETLGVENATQTGAQKVAEEVLVIKLTAKNHQVFYGEKLMQTLLALGLRFGEMNIFHRFERPEEKKGRLFSLANLVEPGYFDIESMASFQTPGVCLFLSLPGPTRPLYAFDLMVDAARKLVHNLGAEMLDEQQNPMTSQIIERYRQRVMAFERNQKLARRADSAQEPA